MWPLSISFDPLCGLEMQNDDALFALENCHGFFGAANVVGGNDDGEE